MALRIGRRDTPEMQRVWKVNDNIPASFNFSFRVLSYNLLSHHNTIKHGYLYKHSLQELLSLFHCYLSSQSHRFPLDWKSRSAWLLDDLKSLDNDVLCLQELDHSHFASLFSPRLSKLGYDSLYLKKLDDKNKDGCAVFWKRSLFTLVDHTLLHYKLHTKTDKDNVGIVVVLKFNQKSKRFGINPHFCIANTHLMFNKRQPLVRFSQFMCIADAMKSLVEKYEALIGHNIPVVLCGDFNINPNTPLHNFISNGIHTHEDNQQLISLTQQSKLPPNYIPTVYHPFELSCVHNPYKSLRGGYYSTSFVEKAELVDYIFVGGKWDSEVQRRVTLEWNRFLEPPDSGFLVPGRDIPSDHVPLVVDFEGSWLP
ncbi:Protein angel 2 [Nowakowskiella sp. JEL0078]|nr:Protein angel 2 [Nowakowskiella sp. JEL0078]